jgi:single-stranded DNA-specific DHH superfamily exonuclease
MRTPHTIERVGEDALDQAEAIRRLADDVQEHGVKMGRLAYMETSQGATGNVAKLLLGAFGVVLGVAYKAKPGGAVEVSLRSTSECKLHLGREIGRIASRHGGTGGGHRKAAGCSVQGSEIQGLLKDIEARLRKAS